MADEAATNEAAGNLPPVEQTTTSASADTSADHAALEALAAALPPATGEVVRGSGQNLAADAPPPASRVHTYSDGSQVVGCPDMDKYPDSDGFPPLSPLQAEAKRIRDETPAQDTFARQQEAIELARKQAAAQSNMVTGAQIEATK